MIDGKSPSIIASQTVSAYATALLRKYISAADERRIYFLYKFAGMETIRLDSIDDLPEAAERLLEIIHERGASVIALFGPMGAGKTTLVRELANQLGVKDTVTSPTFALINQYIDGEGHTVNHFDFYRINNVSEAFDMGYEEYFYGGDICFVEWPEKIEELLPEDTLRVIIEPDPDDEDARTINIV